MSISRDEILGELRELYAAANALDFAKAIRGGRRVTAGQWKSFANSLNRAAQFIHEVDGPKVETGCICHDRSPGQSLMGLPCKLHSTASRPRHE